MTLALMTYTCKVAVRSPFLFRGLAAAPFGVDATALRDDQGMPIIPMDQIRGVLKEALRDLPECVVPAQGPLSIDKLFGVKSEREDAAGAANEPQRRRIHFSDLVAKGILPDPTELDVIEDLPANGAHHTRIEIDPDKGTVKTGALQVVELVAPMGATVLFSGTVEVLAPAADHDRVTDMLSKALALVGAIGGLKSPGFGEVVEEATRLIPEGGAVTLTEPVPRDPARDRRRLRVTFDRPILVNTKRLADNAIESAQVIPGAVFKGTLADRLTHAGAQPTKGLLGDVLAALSVSHAWPLSRAGDRLCRPLPLSLVGAGADGTLTFGDALSVPDGRGAMIGGRPAWFVGDWKSPWFEPGTKAAGYPTGQLRDPVARTHTEIHWDTGTAADHMLYTTLFQPARETDGTPLEWDLDIDLGGLTDDQGRRLAQGLIDLLTTDGLYGVGGTGARATFTEDPGPIQPPHAAPVHGMADRFALMLETPAVLFDPRDAWLADQRTVPARTVYETAWAGLVPGARLLSFFAAQSLAGGYIARRRRAYGKDCYVPFVLTDPGSIFLIEVKDDAGRAALDHAVRFGLAPAAFGTEQVTWKTCPYVPENGYGRVSTTYLSQANQARLMEAVTHA